MLFNHPLLTKQVLKSSTGLPNRGRECLRIDHPQAATSVVVVPHNRGIGLALLVVGLSLSILVAGHVQVLGEQNILVMQNRVELFGRKDALVIVLVVAFLQIVTLFPKLFEKVVRVSPNHPFKILLALLNTAQVLGLGRL